MDPADNTNGGNMPAAGGAPAPPSPPAPLPPLTLPPPPRSARVSNKEEAKAAVPDAPGMADLGSAIVDDGDLIEKEWINRIKQIVAATRSDPYKQSEQLAALRAEYMKKRYGKDIKLGK